MGSRLSRQSSLDNENFSKKRRKLLNSAGESDRGSRGGGDFLFALMLKSDKLPGMLRRTNHSPYMRRVAWIKEIQKLLRDRRIDQATDVLKLLRKDLGLEGTSLNDILYKNAAFLNLVDPISHELLLSLAREMQCPKKDADTIKSSDKICRQLIYHLTPHSKWLRQSMSRRKSQACARQPTLYIFMKSVQQKMHRKIYATSGSRCDETAHLTQMGFTHQRTEMNNREKV